MSPPWNGVHKAMSGDVPRLAVCSRTFASRAKTICKPIVGTSLVAAVDSVPLGLRLLSRGSSASRTLYRVDLVPAGIPSWLSRFDAEGVNDRLRTFGLSRLFESFRQEAQRRGAREISIAHFFVVAN